MGIRKYGNIQFVSIPWEHKIIFIIVLCTVIWIGFYIFIIERFMSIETIIIGCILYFAGRYHGYRSGLFDGHVRGVKETKKKYCHDTVASPDMHSDAILFPV